MSGKLLHLPPPQPLPRTYFYHFLIRCADKKMITGHPNNCPGFLNPLSFIRASNEDGGERGRDVPARLECGWSWKLTPAPGKGLASKGCLQDNRAFSLWCIYTVGLKFCESNSCCKNIVLNMLRTVKRLLLVLHFAWEKCGNLWYVQGRVSALSEAVL